MSNRVQEVIEKIGTPGSDEDWEELIAQRMFRRCRWDGCDKKAPHPKYGTGPYCLDHWKRYQQKAGRPKKNPRAITDDV